MTKRNLALAVALAALGAAWTAPAAARLGRLPRVEGHDGRAVHDDEYYAEGDHAV